MTESLYGEPLTAQSGGAPASAAATNASVAWGPTSAATVDNAGTETDAEDVSPLTAAIEASQWSRADIDLLLHAARTVLLAAAFYYGLKA